MIYIPLFLSTLSRVLKMKFVIVMQWSCFIGIYFNYENDFRP